MSRDNEIEFHLSTAGLAECGRILTLLDNLKADSTTSFIATDERGDTHECEIPQIALEVVRATLMLVVSGETVIVLSRSNPATVLGPIGPQERRPV